MPIDIWCTGVWIFSSNQLVLFNCLNTNPANLDISNISKFSCFCEIIICLVLLACFLVYLNLASAYNYNLNVNSPTIASTLIINLFFIFGYRVFNKLLLESGDIETNPEPKKSSFFNFLLLELKWTSCSRLCEDAFGRNFHHSAKL